MDQFDISVIIELGLLNFVLDFTNSALCLLLICLLVVGFVFSYWWSLVVPNWFQVFFELVFKIMYKFTYERLGFLTDSCFVFVFVLFVLLLFGNLLGMFPFGFTYTSHIVITFFLSLVVFFFVVFFGLFFHGLRFFSFFVPEGVPLFLLPLFIFLEMFSFVVRAFSLAIRLSANMISGHILLHLLISFFLFVCEQGLVYLFFVFFLVCFMFVLEIVVAFLQAYVFVTLTCVYLSEIVFLH